MPNNIFRYGNSPTTIYRHLAGARPCLLFFWAFSQEDQIAARLAKGASKEGGVAHAELSGDSAAAALAYLEERLAAPPETVRSSCRNFTLF